MIVLGIESSGGHSSAAVHDSTTGMTSTVRLYGRGRHSRNVCDAISSVLAQTETSAEAVELVAVGRGPGSFTGLRVAMGVAKGFAFAQNLPLVGVSCLAACAAPACHEGVAVLATADARRGEVYAALYCTEPSGTWPTALTDESAVPLGELGDWLANRIPEETPLLVAGDAALVAVNEVVRTGGRRLGLVAPELRTSASAEAVARLGAIRFELDGADDLDGVDPVYIRPGPGGVH